MHVQLSWLARIPVEYTAMPHRGDLPRPDPKRTLRVGAIRRASCAIMRERTST
jgi:hypothetical protein